MKQTFVYMAQRLWWPDDVFGQLRKLQKERAWDIIIHCAALFYYQAMQNWLPAYRITKVVDEFSYIDPMAEYQTLRDLLKNPDYNRYKFHQSLALDDKAFNTTCFKDFKVSRLFIS